MVPVSSNKFGIIRRVCIANVGKKRGNKSETLMLGTLIQITDYKGEECHVKIRDFTNWSAKYKNTIYKCTKDDYVEVTAELWPYLLASENGEKRLKFVQKVESREFNMDLLKIDCNLRIRGPPNSKIKYYNFTVKYNGVLKQRGIGYYIALQLKDDIPIPFEFQCFTKYYQFKNTIGIVSADWIIFNLYKEEEDQTESSNAIQHSDFSQLSRDLNEMNSNLSANNNKIDINSITKSNQTTIYNNNIDESNKTVRSVKNIEETKCDLCFKTIIIGGGVTLRECIHTFCIDCISQHIAKNSKHCRIQCPYNKEYECQLNLLDAEIKDLTSKMIYRKILQNRLNEYETTNKNAKECPNSNCKNIWIISQSEGSNYGRCPQCNRNWCYKCNETHEPDDRHEQESKEARNHSNELLICRKQPEDYDVSEITGIQMLKLIIDSRHNHLEAAKLIELCCCKPPNSNCSVVLQCKHKFCRTFLMGILQEQLQNAFRAACPICLEVIDDYQKKYLVDQMKLDIGNKCRICSNRADMDLKLCRHSFCLKCVRDLIRNQVSDPKKNTVNCTICSDPIRDSDILQFGSEEMFGLFKSKMTDAAVFPKPVDHISLNSLPFQCISCKQHISIKCGVILAACRDCFCLACCKEFIGWQVANQQIPACPCCRKQIKQFEVDEIIGKLDDVCDYSKFECLKCEEKYDKSLIHRCSQCAVLICLKCSKSTILSQIASKYRPSCPFCQISLDESQIASVLNNQSDISDTVEKPFKCIICKKLPDHFSQIVLIKCKHEICRKCLGDVISDQMRYSLLPQCPICKKVFDQIQLDKLGISSISKHSTKPYTIGLTSEKTSENIDEIKVANNTTNSKVDTKQKIIPNELVNEHKGEITFECIVCDQTLNHFSQIVSMKCHHEICRKCLDKTISDQILHNLSPQCPICRESIDQIHLDELEVSSINKKNTKSNKIGMSRVKISGKTNEYQVASNTIYSNAYTKQKITADDLVNQQRGDIPFECLVCEQSSERLSQIVLTKCKHEICRKCLGEKLSDQIQCNLSPQCPICREPIDQIQLDALGINQETHENELVNRYRGEIPFECLVCEQSTDHFSQIVLTKCKHKICRKCLDGKISDQIQCDLSPQCPICVESIDQIQLDNLGISANRSKVKPSQNSSLKISDNTDTCFVCYEKFRQKIILKNCGHEFCRLCVLMSVKGQVEGNGSIPKCPKCRKLIGPDEIAALKSPLVSNTFSSNRDVLMPSIRNHFSFKCSICSQNIDLESGIILENCNDSLCRDCILKHILQQSKYSGTPECPKCHIWITDEEVHALDSGIYDIFKKNRLSRCLDKKLLNHDEKKSQDVCKICKNSFEFPAIKKLLYCNDHFCRNCIAKALNDQSLIKKVPKCPTCTHEVAGSDIIDLCGSDGFRRYMANKRKAN